MDTEALKAQLRAHEGVRDRAYRDTRGILTVGVGFNLTRADARTRLAAIGADYALVCAGLRALTPRQIDELLDFTIAEACNATRGIVPDFPDLPDAIQLVLVDMVFNLGAAGVSRFRKMLAAVAARDWPEMARQMEDSAWFRQVGVRSQQLVAAVRAVATEDIA